MTETRVTDPKTGAQKGIKPQAMHLIPEDALMLLGEVFGFGAEKYEDRNWEKGYSWSLAYAAMRRHQALWWQEGGLDAESGLSHMAHVAWHALVLCAFELRGDGTDDRPLAERRGKAKTFNLMEVFDEAVEEGGRELARDLQFMYAEEARVEFEGNQL